MSGHIPEAIERLVRDEERRDAALARATAPFGGEPEPDAPQTAAEAFTAHLAEQRRQENEHEARIQRAMFEHPDPPLDEPDPLRSLALEQRAGRQRRRRGSVRL